MADFALEGWSAGSRNCDGQCSHLIFARARVLKKRAQAASVSRASSSCRRRF